MPETERVFGFIVPPQRFTVAFFRRHSSSAILGLIVVIFISISGRWRAKMMFDVLVSKKIELCGRKSFIAFFIMDILPAVFSFMRMLNSISSS